MCSIDGKPKVFVHLHVHSYYSFFDSTMRPEEIVGWAVSNKVSAIALTDTNGMSGAVVFVKAARAAGIKPILGAEITQPFSFERDLVRSRAASEPAGFAGEQSERLAACAPVLFRSCEGPAGSDRSQSPFLCHGDSACRIVVLARNFRGYSEISHLVSRRALDPDFDLLAAAAALSGNVIAISDCVDVLYSCRAAACESYAALIPSPRRRARNRLVYDYAQSSGVPLVVGCDARIAHPGDAPLHDLLQAMRRLTTIRELPESERLDPGQHLQPESAIRAFWGIAEGVVQPAGIRRDLAQAVENSQVIADACNCELPLGEWKFLRFEGVSQSPSRELRELVEQGIRERYGTPPPSAVTARMDYELSVIEKLQFTEYFLLVNRIVREAHSRGYLTVGRGSAANSIVSYALRFTDVCPIRYNLFFERFLNPERNSPPDIDIDFSWRERDAVLEWCFEFFGRDKVALISTIQTLQARGAIREVAKAHGIAEAEVNAFNRLHETGFRVEEKARQAGGHVLTRVRHLAEEEPWRTILEQAGRVTDFPRHLSIHCGGIIIAPCNVMDYVPLTRSAKGFVITQMDMYSVEDMGLIKIDFLSNRSLGVLKDALNSVEKIQGVPAGTEQSNGSVVSPVCVDTANPGIARSVEDTRRSEVFRREASRMKLAGTRRGTSVALYSVLQMQNTSGEIREQSHALVRVGEPGMSPVRKRVFDFEYITTDGPTRALIDSGRTMGCFYIESPGMRALFERLRCRNFDEVVAASSIIRPGVAESGMMQEYIVRHQSVQRENSQSDRLQREMLRAGIADSRTGARVGLALGFAGLQDLRSPTTLMPPSCASERLAKGVMPINAHAKSRDIEEYRDAPICRHSGGARIKDAQGSMKKGERPPHRVMLELLPETYGVMVYQEDVLKVAHEIAGMSLGEADLLRRAMSGKLRSRDSMEQIKEKFFSGSMARGLSRGDAEEIWRQISSFAGYSFCKGHSAAFAVLSYQVAFLKAHYPGEFFAALLSNGGGFYSAPAYLSEARRWGIAVRPPCVNRSKSDYTGRSTRTGGWIRIGLGAILGLREKTCRRILDERAGHGPYSSLSNLIRRVRLSREECRTLIKVGALDCMLQGDPCETRPRLLLQMENAFNTRCESDLFGELPGLPSRLPVSGRVLPAELARFEIEGLGYMLTYHPLDFIRPERIRRLLRAPLVAACNIRRHEGRRVAMLGWAISFKVIATKNSGKRMKMITMEDKTDTFETVFFPRVYEKYSTRTLTPGPYLVRGKIDMTLGSPTLNVEHVETLTC